MTRGGTADSSEHRVVIFVFRYHNFFVAYWWQTKENDKSLCISGCLPKNKPFSPKIVPDAAPLVHPVDCYAFSWCLPCPAFPTNDRKTIANAAVLALRFFIALTVFEASMVLPFTRDWIRFLPMIFFVRRAFKGQTTTVISNHVAQIRGHSFSSTLRHLRTYRPQFKRRTSFQSSHRNVFYV